MRKIYIVFMLWKWMEGHKPHSLENFPVVLDRTVIHYTCNAPSQKVLDRYGVKCRGNQFGCANPREVLEIPRRVYRKFGFSEFMDKPILNLNLEKLMRILS